MSDLICHKCGSSIDKPHRRELICKLCISARNGVYAKQQRLNGNPRPNSTTAKKASYLRQKDTPEFRKKQVEWTAKWRAKPENKIKTKARAALNQKIRSGKIAKSPCEICGNSNAQAHHEDYSKPFDVHWFCRPCHSKHHAVENLIADQARTDV